VGGAACVSSLYEGLYIISSSSLKERENSVGNVDIHQLVGGFLKSSSARNQRLRRQYPNLEQKLQIGARRPPRLGQHGP